MTSPPKVIGLWLYTNDGNVKNVEKIENRLRQAGYQVISGFNLNNCYVRDGQVYTDSGENLSESDIFYFMNVDQRSDYSHLMLQFLELSGVKLINPFAVYDHTADKAKTNMILTRAGIKTAPFLLINNDAQSLARVRQAFDDWGSAVIKQRIGAGGKGIVKVESFAQFEEFFEYSQEKYSDFYLEKYIPFGDRDYRVDMIDGKIVHLYSRVKGGSYKTNVHSGVRKLDHFNRDADSFIALSKKICHLLNIEATIIDFAISTEDNDIYVIEVNENLGMFMQSFVKELTDQGKNVDMPSNLIDDERKIGMVCDYLEKRLLYSTPKSYPQYYARNIGIFTEENQERLRKSHVFFAGTGGIGGIQAATLARLGVGKITIMDPGIFDEPDFNRQYAAFSDTLGMNKAEATAAELKRLAPFAEVITYAEKLSQDKLDEIVRGCDVVIDAIDLEDYDYKILTAQLARKHGKYNFSCPIPDFGAVMMIFHPQGMTMEEFTRNRCYPKISTAHRKHNKPISYSSETGMGFLSSKASISCASALSAAMVCAEVGMFLCGKRALDNLTIVPEVSYIDLEEKSYEVFQPEPHPLS